VRSFFYTKASVITAKKTSGRTSENYNDTKIKRSEEWEKNTNESLAFVNFCKNENTVQRVTRTQV
jgi:hypothetical protein